MSSRGLLLMALVLAACLSNGPTPPKSTSGMSISEISGALPDGTEYALRADAFAGDSIQGISAAVVVDLPDGTFPVIGIMSFGSGNEQSAAALENGRMRLVGGDWTIQIEIYDHILEALGPDAESILASSITAETRSGLPVLVLEPPFRFASDDEIPLEMMVMYRDFTVMRGCDEQRGAVCNLTRAIQVVPTGEPLPESIRIELSSS